MTGHEALEAFLDRRARRDGRGAGAAARREAAARASSPTRTRGWRSSATRPRPRRSGMRRIEALEQLREALNLESLPLRIECFDVSNIQGREIVASMSVAIDGQPRAGALPQLRDPRPRGPGRLRRDGTRRSAGASRGCATRATRRVTTRASPPRPNLVVIDGGKGQLAAALAAIRATPDLPRLAVVSLAKREEEVFVPGVGASRPARPPRPGAAAAAARARRGAPLRARAPPSPARHARVRVDLRRARRDRAGADAVRSSGTSARPTASSPPRREELEGVPGLPARTARAVYDQLHRTGG